MGSLIAIARPERTQTAGRTSASDDLVRYARHEFREDGTTWLLGAPSRPHAVTSGCALEPRDWTLRERLVRAVASLF